jgi:hypothetical protein
MSKIWLIENPITVIEYGGLPMDKGAFDENDIKEPNYVITDHWLVAFHYDIKGILHTVHPHMPQNAITKLEAVNLIANDIKMLKTSSRESRGMLDGLVLQRVKYANPEHVDVEFTYETKE